MSKKLNRRDFLRLGSMAAAGGMIAACAPKQTDAPAGEPTKAAPTAVPEKEGVELQFWIFWSQPDTVMPELLATESLKVALGNNTMDFKTGVNEEARLTAVAAGTPPDVGVLGNYLDFMSRGAVIPLDDYIDASSTISEDKFIPGNWQVIQYQGKVYGVPAIECFVRRGLGYNARMIEAEGLDPDSPPDTWEDLFVWHEKLTKFDDAGNLLQIGLDPYDAEGGTGPGNDGWPGQEFGGIEYFDEGSKTFNLDNEMIAGYLDTMAEFVKVIGADNLAGMRQVEGQGTWGGSFNAEVQAMIIEGYWHPGETFNQKPDVAEVLRSTWVPVPASRKGTKMQFGGGHMAFIFKDGNYRDEAWPIIEWLQADDFCDIIFEGIGWLPAYKPYFDGADTDKFPGLQFYFDSVNDANYWGPFITCEIQAFVRTKYVELREAVYREIMTGAEAAAQLQQDAENEWKAAGFG